MSRAGRRGRTAAVVGLVVSAVCVVIILTRVDVAAVFAETRAADPAPLLASLLTKGLGFGFLAWRGAVLLRPLHRYRFAIVVRSVFLAFLGNTALPLRLGELLRVEYLAREGAVARSSTLAVVVFERLLDAFFLLVLLLATSPLLAADLTRLSLVVSAAAVVASLAVLLAAVRWPERVGGLAARGARLLGRRLEQAIAPRVHAFVHGLGALGSPRALASVGVATTGYWLCSAASVKLWFVGFRLDLPWYAPLVMLVMLAFGAAIPSSPGYVGTYDYFAMQALALFDVPTSTAASLAIVGHVLAVVPFSLLAVVVVYPTFRTLLGELDGAGGVAGGAAPGAASGTTGGTRIDP